MPEQMPEKIIFIYDDCAVIRTGNFTFKSSITENRDINGCVASCIEKVTNGQLTGVTITDKRSK